MPRLNRTYYEHESGAEIKDPLNEDMYEFKFPKKNTNDDNTDYCFQIIKNIEGNYYLNSSYYIGIDWLNDKSNSQEDYFIQINPKLDKKDENNKNDKKLNYLKMLFSSLKHPGISDSIKELYEIKWDSQKIEIEQENDYLTPFLAVEFLSVLKKIVKKGLKKSYYKVEHNLNSRIKGKVLVGKTIKQNILQNKNLYTYCRYDEFGLNNKENRLLNKTYQFVKKYLSNYKAISNHKDLINTLNYINPAFHGVSDQIELNEIKFTKINAFYKEYENAINLAKMILKRFSYNITNTTKQKIETPPFWIDMSKLFEIYVYGLLYDSYGNKVKYHHKTSGNELDYLLNTDEFKMVIDAKYKPRYKKQEIDNEDARQVSGYARLKNVYKELEIDLDKNSNVIIDCLIIYPDQKDGLEIITDLSKKNEVKYYHRIYDLGIQLPIIET